MPFDTSLRNAPEAKAKLGPYEQGVSKALTKAGEQQATEALMSNVPPEHIARQAGLTSPQQSQGFDVLARLNELASQQVEQSGTIKGPFLALKDLVSGKGFNPLAPHTSPRGINQAATILNLEMQGQKMPLETRKLELDIEKALGELTAKGEEKKGRLPAETLFKQYEEKSKPFEDVRDGFGRIVGVFQNPDTGEFDFSGTNPGGDLDLLFGTAKTLDPGGKVTDSDIAIQTMVTGAYGDGLKRIAQRFQRKGTLTPDERVILFNTALKRFKAAENQQRKTIDEFGRLASASGFDAKNLFRDVGLNLQKAPSNPKVSTKPKEQSGVMKTKSGNTFKPVKSGGK